MWNRPKEDNLFEHFGKNAKILGWIFIVLGVLGVIFPTVMSFTTNIFVAWLMLLAGMMAGYFTYITDKKDWLGWLKSLILIGVALYMLLSPLSGVATLGLLFSIYFFMDAFAGMGLAVNAYPHKGWWIWAVNALLSFGLAIFFIIGWPFSSLFMVGTLVGISLFFDGLALLQGGKWLKEMTKI